MTQKCPHLTITFDTEGKSISRCDGTEETCKKSRSKCKTTERCWRINV